jgi:hypothetical protein
MLLYTPNQNIVVVKAEKGNAERCSKIFHYCICGLVVRVPKYRSRGPWIDFRRYQIFSEVVGLERGPLSLGRIIEELLE